jgi:hypothetical protein
VAVGVEVAGGVCSRRKDGVDAEVGVPRVARTGEVHRRREQDRGCRQRQPLVPYPQEQRRGEVAPGRAAANDDVLGPTLRQQGPVDGHAIVEADRERVVRGHPVVDRPCATAHACGCAEPGVAADGAAAQDERAAVDVEERPPVVLADSLGRDVVDVDAVDLDLLHRGIGNRPPGRPDQDVLVHQGDSLAPRVEIVQGQVRERLTGPPGEHRLRLRADVGGHRDVASRYVQHRPRLADGHGCSLVCRGRGWFGRKVRSATGPQVPAAGQRGPAKAARAARRG